MTTATVETVDLQQLREEFYQEEFARVMENTMRNEDAKAQWMAATPEERDQWVANHRANFDRFWGKAIDAIETRDCSMIRRGLFDPRNKQWRAIFTRATGIKLSSTVGATNAALTEWLGADRVAEYERSENEKKQAEEDAKKAARELADRRYIDAVIAKVQASETITGREFLDVARHYGFDVHLRTAGTILKRVIRISPGQTRCVMGRGGKGLPDNVWRLYQDVSRKAWENMPDPADDEKGGGE